MDGAGTHQLMGRVGEKDKQGGKKKMIEKKNRGKMVKRVVD